MNGPTTEQTYQHGRDAYDAHRPMDDCPNYAMGEQGYQLRSAWRRGWNDRNTEAAREVTKR